MLLERIKSAGDALLKQLSEALPTGRSAAVAPSAPTGVPLEGARAVVLVTGASGKTGAPVVRRLLETGAAARVVAHVSPSSQATEWDDDARVRVVRADLATQPGVDAVARAAADAGVGSVVFAASGGPSACAAVDNDGVRRLAAALAPTLAAAPAADLRHLFDVPAAAAAAFSPLDDVVMGGRSASTLAVVDGVARFSGLVTTVGGGGFAQVRAPLAASPLAPDAADTLDLSAFDGVQLRVRGDGPARTYKFNLKDEDVPDFAFQSAFTVAGRGWRVVRLPFSSFVPMKRGVPQYADAPGGAVYARSLDLTRLRTVGIVLSLVSDGVRVANVREREGRFALDFSSISAFRAAPPRFVLVSSAAVTRPFWSEQERRAKGAAATEIPIVQMNPGLILAHKLAGENALRASGLSYAVVRPIGLNDTVPDARRVVLAQGDLLSGRVHRADVARAVLAVLRSPHAAYKTFELGALPDQPADDDADDLDDARFAALADDDAELLYADAVRDMLANAPQPVASPSS